MAAAFAYCKGDGPRPMELDAAKYIDRFGAQSVYGRPLTVGEMERISRAEDIVQAFYNRKASTDWAAWAKDHEYSARILELAQVAYVKCRNKD